LAEIGFYHLSSTPLERALPKLLERASAQGHSIVVRAGSAERAEHLCAVLWIYEEGAFLPHGSASDGHAAAQPIWLTHREENPNGASILVLVDGSEASDLQSFSRCLDLFDGNDPGMVQAARSRWRRARDAGHVLTYWQQTHAGWERKT
jgi:DNA polymerase III subunit chi